MTLGTFVLIASLSGFALISVLAIRDRWERKRHNDWLMAVYAEKHERTMARLFGGGVKR